MIYTCDCDWLSVHIFVCVFLCFFVIFLFSFSLFVLVWASSLFNNKVELSWVELHKLWICDVEEFCCCVELTAAHVCFAHTAEHLSALFMTVVDWQFFSSLRYVQDLAVFQKKMSVVSRISAVFFIYRDNSAKPNISRNFFTASREFKKIGLVVYRSGSIILIHAR